MAIEKSTKSSQPPTSKKILRRCSSFDKKNSGYDKLRHPVDVPKGHFTVYVGDNKVRYIIPISFLSQPEFQKLLQQAEDEFGFNHDMGITIPCQQVVFEALTSTFKSCSSCLKLIF